MRYNVDDKWSIEYDESNNDTISRVYRHNVLVYHEVDNLTLAMHYKILDLCEKLAELEVMKKDYKT